MNFGRRWSEALTVTISKRNERNFAAAGLDPKRLENRRVRVRGWIEERNGPRIEAASPEQSAPEHHCPRKVTQSYRSCRRWQ